MTEMDDRHFCWIVLTGDWGIFLVVLVNVTWLVMAVLENGTFETLCGKGVGFLCLTVGGRLTRAADTEE